MSFSTTEVTTVAHSIQLAVAPVFLLSGIGVFLGVLTSRLARVVDRARPLQEELASAAPHLHGDLRERLVWLAKRGRLINLAITLSTVAALLVAIVVGALFASTFEFVQFSLALPVATLFILSMASLVGALVAFLIEVQIATRTIRIGPPP